MFLKQEKSKMVGGTELKKIILKKKKERKCLQGFVSET